MWLLRLPLGCFDDCNVVYAASSGGAYCHEAELDHCVTYLMLLDLFYCWHDVGRALCSVGK